MLLQVGCTVEVAVLLAVGVLHSAVFGSLFPVRMIELLRRTFSCLASKVDVHPLSRRVPMDKSVWRSAGKTCALRAAAGSV